MAAIDSGPPRTPVPAGVIPAEWPVQAADAIVDTIGKVRDRTTKPAVLAARAVVYGILALVMAVIAAVLLITMIVRIWDVYVPGKIWIIYAIFAVVFSTGGAVLMKRASAPSTATTT